MASDPAWCGLGDWQCEVLAFAAMASYEQPMTAGDGLQRVLSVIASGLIERGMADPTDQAKDVFAYLTRQARIVNLIVVATQETSVQSNQKAKRGHYIQSATLTAITRIPGNKVCLSSFEINLSIRKSIWCCESKSFRNHRS